MSRFVFQAASLPRTRELNAISCPEKNRNEKQWKMQTCMDTLFTIRGKGKIAGVTKRCDLRMAVLEFDSGVPE